LQDIINILIPKLNLYPLLGVKRLDFKDFRLVVELIEKKEHLTLEGFNKIKQIKSGMNTARKLNIETKLDESSRFLNLSSSDPSLTNTFLTNPFSTNPFLINTANNLEKSFFQFNVRGRNRVGPHHKEIIDVIIGSLLGKANANNRSGEGVRICYRQSIIHKEYLF
jgi:hypothetical protein